MNNQNNKGRGRPKGAVSFTKMDLNTLQQHFGPNQKIPVSRVWLEQNEVINKPKPPVDMFAHVKY